MTEPREPTDQLGIGADMTDRTHPDSGFPIAYSHYATYAEYVEALHTRIAELEAQLEAIRAGGVSGPLMGQPQEMPDLTALTERGAVAWAGVDAQALRDGRWYMVNKDGAATLCVDEEDAKECAAHAFVAFPHMGPHRAVQLVEASTAGFTAADMASASAQGFRDGVASIAASAGSEPVATVFTMEALAPGGGVKYHATVHKPLPAGTKLYLHPSPPEGMVAEQALRKVLSVVQRYLPPDGPTAHDAMTEITEIVDPWPLGPLEKP